jgi:polyisoprenoid-binding protein YceI
MTATAAPVRLAPGRWTVVAERTAASFTVGNLGKTVRGTIRVTAGAVDVGDDGRPLAVRADLDLRTVDTGHARRDTDLRKKGLLDIEEHPTMTFECATVRSEGVGWRAEGRLALRGTACPLLVTGSLVEDCGPDGVHVVGTATLDRTAIGIRAPRLMIGRTVTISVDAWLSAPS